MKHLHQKRGANIAVYQFKHPPETSIPYMSIKFELWMLEALLLYFQLRSQLTYPGGQQKMAQALGPMIFMWDIQMKFLTPGFGLIQLWLHLGTKQVDGRPLFSVNMPFK